MCVCRRVEAFDWMWPFLLYLVEWLGGRLQPKTIRTKWTQLREGSTIGKLSEFRCVLQAGCSIVLLPKYSNSAPPSPPTLLLHSLCLGLEVRASLDPDLFVRSCQCQLLWSSQVQDSRNRSGTRLVQNIDSPYNYNFRKYLRRLMAALEFLHFKIWLNRTSQR